MKFRITVYLLIMLGCFHSVALLSEEQKKELSETITIIAPDNNAPFNFSLPDGTMTGLYIEFWELWSESNKIPISFVTVPFEVGLQLVKQKNTIYSGLFRNEQRDLWADFSLPIHNVQTGILYNRSFNKSSKLRELNNIKVTAQRLSFQESYLKENFIDIELSTFDSLEQGVNFLLNNEVQAVVAELPNINATLAKMGLTGVFVISEEIIVSNNVFAMLAKNQPELLAQVNAGIENIPVNKIIELEKKWLPTLKPFFSHHDALESLTLAETQWLQNNPNFLIGFDSDLPPFEFIDANGVYAGLASDYITYANDLLGINMAPKYGLNWLEAFEAFKSGEVDIMSAAIVTPERLEIMNFTDPYIDMPTAIIIRKDSFYVDNMSSLNDKVLGLVEGDFVQFVKDDYPEIKIKIVASEVDGLEVLQDGGIDAFIAPIAVANFEIDKMRMNDLVVAAFSPYNLKLSMAIRKGLEPLVPILNKAFAHMTIKQKSLVNNTWLRSYVKTGTEISTIIVWVLPIVLFLLLIILIFIRMNRRFKELSLTDQLTGLRNRRFLRNNIKSDVDNIIKLHSKSKTNQWQIKHNDSDLVFFLMDFDHFKQINDIYGHAAGDAVLIQIKSILEKAFSKTDYLVRWGGEEFLVVSRFINRDQAPIIAERLRQSIEAHNFDIGQGDIINKTCSIGFACFPFLVNKPEYLVWEQVVDIADHCMFAAKKSNRNAWVGLNNINFSAENRASEITENTKELIESRQLEVLSSVTDKSFLNWD